MEFAFNKINELQPGFLKILTFYGTIKIEKHENANHIYLEEGGRILELAQHAVILYEKQDMLEKRRLLNFVFSNSSWKDGRLSPVYRKPFDLLAVTNLAYQREKALSSAQEDLFDIWCLGPDSNRHGANPEGF
ncbi:MAG: hypothetical protein FJ121_01785 [Deltaproteobacteria bacterium]|nr:hypothetical protein [Deltaproteobacteria bacterium]